MVPYLSVAGMLVILVHMLKPSDTHSDAVDAHSCVLPASGKLHMFSKGGTKLFGCSLKRTFTICPCALVDSQAFESTCRVFRNAGRWVAITPTLL